MGRQGHPGAHMVCIHTHTPCFLGAFPLPAPPHEQMFLCSRDPCTGPPHTGTGGSGGSTCTDCCPNHDLYFQFSKRLCFHLQRCCLLLFDLNKVKDNRIQMKYISTLILHSFQVLWQEQIQLQSEAHPGLSDSHSDLTALSAAVKCSWSQRREHGSPVGGWWKSLGVHFP